MPPLLLGGQLSFRRHLLADKNDEYLPVFIITHCFFYCWLSVIIIYLYVLIFIIYCYIFKYYYLLSIIYCYQLLSLYLFSYPKSSSHVATYTRWMMVACTGWHATVRGGWGFSEGASERPRRNSGPHVVLLTEAVEPLISAREASS